MTDNRNTRLEDVVMSQLLSNVANFDTDTLTVPDYLMDLPDIAFDPTSPLFIDGETLAPRIFGKSLPAVEFGEVSSVGRVLKHKEDIEKSAIMAANSLGMTFDPVHLEDLIYIAGMSGGISYLSVWMYLRGVTRTNQISVVSRVAKITGSLEGALAKTQYNIAQNSDANKIMMESLASLTLKIDKLGSSLINNIKAEILAIVSKLSSSINKITSTKTKTAPATTDVASSSKNAPTHPGLEELKDI